MQRIQSPYYEVVPVSTTTIGISPDLLNPWNPYNRTGRTMSCRQMPNDNPWPMRSNGQSNAAQMHRRALPPAALGTIRDTPSPLLASYYPQPPTTARRDTANLPIKAEIADDESLPAASLANQVIDISSDEDREDGAAAAPVNRSKNSVQPETMRRHRSVDDVRSRNSGYSGTVAVHRRDRFFGHANYDDGDSNDFPYVWPNLYTATQNQFEENSFSSLPPDVIGDRQDSRDFDRPWDSSNELFQGDANMLDQPMNLANRLKRSRHTGKSRSKVFLLNETNNGTMSDQPTTDDDESSNGAAATKPIMVRNMAESNDEVSSTSNATEEKVMTIKKEIGADERTDDAGVADDATRGNVETAVIK